MKTIRTEGTIIWKQYVQREHWTTSWIRTEETLYSVVQYILREHWTGWWIRLDETLYSVVQYILREHWTGWWIFLDGTLDSVVNCRTCIIVFPKYPKINCLKIQCALSFEIKWSFLDSPAPAWDYLFLKNEYVANLLLCQLLLIKT